MNPHTLLALFATLVLAGLTMIGTSSEKLGFNDRAQQFVPQPVPLILPHLGGSTTAREKEFFLRHDLDSLPPGLVSLAP